VQLADVANLAVDDGADLELAQAHQVTQHHDVALRQRQARHEHL
jgi:hypothetical protein